jgi:type III pantothenate kinase
MNQLLLIGNSRWHWAEQSGQGLRCWHATAPADVSSVQPALRAWAAVGQVPPALLAAPVRRIGLVDVPLRGLPPWLGIDRALVGWRAWQQQGKGVLVADAGTALSLTRIDAGGHFAGGLISAGVALQLRALGAATAALPCLAYDAPQGSSSERWPTTTVEAMHTGCLQATAAAVAAAWRDLQAQPGAGVSQLWLTGGDAERLAPLLHAQQLKPHLAPDLVMEALAALPVVGLLR